MEGNFNFKNIKPTLSTPTAQGKQLDTNFKKQMRPTGMSLKEKEDGDLDKKTSLKKKIFKLDKMETLVHTDENLAKIFNEMKEDAAEKFGYHWNETILNIIFNDYILNSPKYLHKYKVTRAKPKTRRGEEGIAQLQNDIDKEREASSNAEERKNDLMAGVEGGEEKKEKVDELFGFSTNTKPAPIEPRSQYDQYFIDTRSNKLLGVAPYLNKSKYQEVISQFAGQPNVRQVDWNSALHGSPATNNKPVQGVPAQVSDQSPEQAQQAQQAAVKYAGVPAMVREEEVSETTGSASSGAFSMGLDAQGKQSKEVADKTYQNETTTSASSGQYSGPGIWAKNPENSRFAHKPAWKGGKILEESIINGDLDYLTDPSAFRKYIIKSEILQLLNEAVDPNMTPQQQAQKMAGKLQYYANLDPILKNDPQFQALIQQEIEKSKGGQQQPAPAQQPVAATPAPAQQQAPAQPDNTTQWKQQPAPMAEAPLEEHHLHTKEDKIDFILQNTYDDGADSAKYSKEQLDAMSDQEVDSIYLATEKKIGIDEAAIEAMEKENPMYEANNFIKTMVKDLKYTGREANDNESADELESKDGLFKGKWNDNKDVKDEPVAEGMGGDPEVGEDQYKEEQGANEYMALETQLKELTALKNAGDIQGLKAKIESLPVIPMANNSGSPEGIGHRDLEDLGYLKCDYEVSSYGGEDDFDHELVIRNISNKPVVMLDPYHHNTHVIEPGQMMEAKSNSKALITEKAVSKKQQKFFGMVHAAQKGKLKHPSKAVAKVAGEISDKDADDFASTKHKGLPEKVKKDKKKDKLDESMNISENHYKELVRAKLKSSGKSLKNMGDDEKKKFFNEADGEYQEVLKESMIDDQPDSIINNQEDSIAKSMDSDELNKDGAPTSSSAPAVAAAPVGGAVEEAYDVDDIKAKPSVMDKMADYSEEEPTADEPEEVEPVTPEPSKTAPQYYNQGGEDAQTAIDAEKFRAALKAKYGVDSVADLSHRERQELMNSMNFGAKKKAEINPQDFTKTDAQRAEYHKYNDPTQLLAFLNKNLDKLRTPDDYKRLAPIYKAETGREMQVPMAIYATLQGMSPEERSKYAGLENYFKSNMSENMNESKELNEERKNSAILNVEKLGDENAKNFVKDMPKEDALNQDKTYPKDDGIHKAPVWPDPSKFYIEQDPKKFTTAKSMADIEKEALAKSKGALANIGNATADGKNIPKRNLTKEEGYALAMNRGDGMQDIVYDNKPSEKFEKRMEQDMGEHVYKARQDKMDYKAQAPMYNKDTQPTEEGDDKNQYNKFAKGYNLAETFVSGKYRDENGKVQLVEFKMTDVQELTSIDEHAFKLSMDGMGNKYALVGKKINENVDYEKVTEKYNFYLVENKVVAVEKKVEETKPQEGKKTVNESKFDKMKHLMNYKPTNYVDTKKSVKF